MIFLLHDCDIDVNALRLSWALFKMMIKIYLFLKSKIHDYEAIKFGWLDQFFFFLISM